MTLNSALIQAGFRESNFVGQSTILADDEQTEGMQLLQSLTLTMPGLILGHKWRNWFIPYPNRTAEKGGDFPARSDREFTDLRYPNYPQTNARVVLRNAAAETLYMPQMPSDGALMQFVDAGFQGDVTLDANGNFFGTSGVATTVTLTTGVAGGNRLPTRTYIYRGDIASWIRLDSLIYNAESAWPAEFDDFWITAMAIRLSPRFGNEPRSATIARYQEMVVFLRGWYRLENQEVLTSADTHNSDQSWGGYGGLGGQSLNGGF